MLERIPALSRVDFFRDYHRARQPVIMTGLLEAWPAFHRWSPSYLKSVCGDALVEIMGERNVDPQFEANCERHRRQVSFSDYVDTVITGTGNDAYMVANNRFLDTEAGGRLRGDVIPFPEYLNPADSSGRMFFWLGPAGTVTPFHYDTTNILLCQVIGHKRLCLIPPTDTPRMYNRIGVFSDVDYDRPDPIRFPLYSQVMATDFLLNPGEVLFIPTGWWHHVRSLTPSLSVSLTNFLSPDLFR